MATVSLSKRLLQLQPVGTLCSVASLLGATLYQGICMHYVTAIFFTFHYISVVPAIIVAVSAGVRQFDGYGNTSA
jgi:hypothetical protein